MSENNLPSGVPVDSKTVSRNVDGSVDSCSEFPNFTNVNKNPQQNHVEESPGSIHSSQNQEISLNGHEDTLLFAATQNDKDHENSEGSHMYNGYNSENPIANHTSEVPAIKSEGPDPNKPEFPQKIPFQDSQTPNNSFSMSDQNDIFQSVQHQQFDASTSELVAGSVKSDSQSNLFQDIDSESRESTAISDLEPPHHSDLRTELLAALCRRNTATPDTDALSIATTESADADDCMQKVDGKKVGRRKKLDDDEEESVGRSPLSYELKIGHRILKEFLIEANKSLTWPFLNAVDPERDHVEDYYEKVTNPMWFNRMKEKFVNREYESIRDFVSDFRLMLENCYRYNGPDHAISKKAQRLETMLEQKLSLLSRELREKTSISGTAGSGVEEKQITGSRRRKVLVPHDSTALLQQLRIEQVEREKEARRSQIIERKQQHEAALKEVDDWEDDLMLAETRSQMKAMWEIPQIGHFLFLCQGPLNIGEVMQFELERCFLMPKESTAMQRVMTALLSTPYQRTRLHRKPLMPYKVWEEKLRIKVRHFYKVLKDTGLDMIKACQKLGLDEKYFKVVGITSPLEKKKYDELSFYQKVWLMKGLCDYCLENQESLREAIEAQPETEQRDYVLGSDAQGNSYLHFPQFCGADVRIYRQSPIEMPTLDIPKITPKKSSSKKRSSAKKKKTPNRRVKEEPIETPSQRTRHSRLRQNPRQVQSYALADEPTGESSEPTEDTATEADSGISESEMDDHPLSKSPRSTRHSSRGRDSSSASLSTRTSPRRGDNRSRSGSSTPVPSPWSAGAGGRVTRSAWKRCVDETTPTNSRASTPSVASSARKQSRTTSPCEDDYDNLTTPEVSPANTPAPTPKKKAGKGRAKKSSRSRSRKGGKKLTGKATMKYLDESDGNMDEESSMISDISAMEKTQNEDDQENDGLNEDVYLDNKINEDSSANNAAKDMITDGTIKESDDITAHDGDNNCDSKTDSNKVSSYLAGDKDNSDVICKNTYVVCDIKDNGKDNLNKDSNICDEVEDIETSSKIAENTNVRSGVNDVDAQSEDSEMNFSGELNNEESESNSNLSSTANAADKVCSNFSEFLRQDSTGFSTSEINASDKISQSGENSLSIEAKETVRLDKEVSSYGEHLNESMENEAPNDTIDSKTEDPNYNSSVTGKNSIEVARDKMETSVVKKSEIELKLADGEESIKEFEKKENQEDVKSEVLESSNNFRTDVKDDLVLNENDEPNSIEEKPEKVTVIKSEDVKSEIEDGKDSSIKEESMDVEIKKTDKDSESINSQITPLSDGAVDIKSKDENAMTDEKTSDGTTTENTEVKQEPIEEEIYVEPEILHPDLDEFEMVVQNVDDLRQLAEKFEEPQPVVVGSGKWEKVMPATPRKRCERDLHSRLLFLLKELEPWESKLLSANKKAKLKLKREKETYVEEPEKDEVEDVWESEPELSSDENAANGSDYDPNEHEKQPTKVQTRFGGKREKKKPVEVSEDSQDIYMEHTEEYGISSKGRIRKRRVIPNNVEDQSLQPKKSKSTGRDTKKASALQGNKEHKGKPQQTGAKHTMTHLSLKKSAVTGSKSNANQGVSQNQQTLVLKASVPALSGSSQGQPQFIQIPAGSLALKNPALLNQLIASKGLTAGQPIILQGHSQQAQKLIQNLIAQKRAEASAQAAASVTTAATSVTSASVGFQPFQFKSAVSSTATVISTIAQTVKTSPMNLNVASNIIQPQHQLQQQGINIQQSNTQNIGVAIAKAPSTLTTPSMQVNAAQLSSTQKVVHVMTPAGIRAVPLSQLPPHVLQQFLKVQQQQLQNQAAISQQQQQQQPQTEVAAAATTTAPITVASSVGMAQTGALSASANLVQLAMMRAGGDGKNQSNISVNPNLSVANASNNAAAVTNSPLKNPGQQIVPQVTIADGTQKRLVEIQLPSANTAKQPTFSSDVLNAERPKYAGNVTVKELLEKQQNVNQIGNPAPVTQSEMNNVLNSPEKTVELSTGNGLITSSPIANTSVSQSLPHTETLISPSKNSIKIVQSFSSVPESVPLSSASATMNLSQVIMNTQPFNTSPQSVSLAAQSDLNAMTLLQQSMQTASDTIGNVSPGSGKRLAKIAVLAKTPQGNKQVAVVDAAKLQQLIAKKQAIDNAVKQVITDIPTSLPTANIKVTSPFSMPSRRPHRPCTKTTSTMKHPIAAVPQISSATYLGSSNSANQSTSNTAGIMQSSINSNFGTAGNTGTEIRLVSANSVVGIPSSAVRVISTESLAIGKLQSQPSFQTTTVTTPALGGVRVITPQQIAAAGLKNHAPPSSTSAPMIKQQNVVLTRQLINTPQGIVQGMSLPPGVALPQGMLQKTKDGQLVFVQQAGKARPTLQIVRPQQQVQGGQNIALASGLIQGNVVQQQASAVNVANLQAQIAQVHETSVATNAVGQTLVNNHGNLPNAVSVQPSSFNLIQSSPAVQTSNQSSTENSSDPAADAAKPLLRAIQPKQIQQIGQSQVVAGNVMALQQQGLAVQGMSLQQAAMLVQPQQAQNQPRLMLLNINGQLVAQPMAVAQVGGGQNITLGAPASAAVQMGQFNAVQTNSGIQLTTGHTFSQANIALTQVPASPTVAAIGSQLGQQQPQHQQIQGQLNPGIAVIGSQIPVNQSVGMTNIMTNQITPQQLQPQQNIGLNLVQPAQTAQIQLQGGQLAFVGGALSHLVGGATAQLVGGTTSQILGGATGQIVGGTPGQIVGMSGGQTLMVQQNVASTDSENWRYSVKN